MPPEPWLRGPVPGVDPYLQPAAHALLQAAEDIERVAEGLDAPELWATPGGAASVGFHLRHMARSIDRLLAYARGAQLDERQRAALSAEGVPGDPPVTAAALVTDATRAIRSALDAIRSAPPDALLEPRVVGRDRLSSTLLGLLFHLAEHTQRHTGQIITTAKIVRGQTLDPSRAARRGSASDADATGATA